VTPEYARWLEYGTTRYFQFPVFTSKGLIQTRIDRHNLMGHTPTVTGRFTNAQPNIQELDPMDRNPENITDPKIRRLSEFLFSLYHNRSTPGEPEHGEHSRVSDRIAKSLAGDPKLIMDLATLMGHCHGMPENNEVTAFAGQRAQPEVELPDWLKDLCGQDTAIEEGDPGITLADMLRGAGIVAINLGALLDDDEDDALPPLIDEAGDMDFRSLWYRVFLMLGGEEADVTFDPAYYSMGDEDNPAIHGPGVTPFTVNGAIMAVLDAENCMQYIETATQVMADEMDGHGWVYCSHTVID